MRHNDKFTRVFDAQQNGAGTSPLRRLVTPAEALYSPEFLGLPVPEHPDDAAALRIARRTYPLPTVLIDGRRRMVRVSDIYAYIDLLQPMQTAAELAVQLPQNPRKKKRGRRSNAELAGLRMLQEAGA